MRRSLSVLSALALAASGLAATAATAAPPSNPGTDRAAEVAAHWTAERMAAAQPRDLVLDERGLAYLRSRDGSLRPYGHGTPARPTAKPVEQAKPSGGGKPGGTTTTTVVKNARWTGGGTVKTAAGRIYFHMYDGPDLVGYVCSGTVVTNLASSRSVILTAAHCVFDDVAKKFASKVMFIPDQDSSRARTDQTCSNDRLGCWIPSHGVVDKSWTTDTFPNNIPWDYAYYVVPSEGAHTAGFTTAVDSLEAATGSLLVSFDTPATGSSGSAWTHALGYSYSNDPYFMYCAQGMTTNGSANWWLGSCGLSGGASGGPWMQPVSSGNGPVISVNSWGYANQPGMAGPKLSGTSSAKELKAVAESLMPTGPAVLGTIATG